jgi:hypothetical protein
MKLLIRPALPVIIMARPGTGKNKMVPQGRPDHNSPEKRSWALIPVATGILLRVIPAPRNTSASVKYGKCGCRCCFRTKFPDSYGAPLRHLAMAFHLASVLLRRIIPSKRIKLCSAGVFTTAYFSGVGKSCNNDTIILNRVVEA